MSSSTVTEIADNTANPAPLGLIAFGTTTVLLNLHNAGFFALNAMILAMGIFYGGLAQIIAGIMEWKKNNTFGATAFTSYGCFWLTLVGLVLLPKSPYGVAAADGSAMAAYLAIWGLFTFGLFIGTLRLSRALQFVFLTLTVLFFMLAYAEHSGNASVTKLAGYEGIVCGASAMYTGIALVLNEVYGQVILPLGAAPRPAKPTLAPA
ncbi:MAG TPA: acetate uptake transporter [Opitutaceae bacterium]|nr:acetate uptake transporter [Opitutaceae bacterium]